MRSPIAIKLLMLAALGMGYVLLAACNGDYCASAPAGAVCATDNQSRTTHTCQSGDCKPISSNPPTNKCGADIGDPCTTPSGDTGKCVLDVPNNTIVCGIGL